MAVANVCYHMSIPVANEKHGSICYHCYHEFRALPFGPFLLRCIMGQTQTQIPDVIPCYFIVKCSGFVTHHINLSHVYGSGTAEVCPTITRRVTKQSGFSLVNNFLTCCCDGCCQMTEYARNSNVQVSFMKLVAISNYRIKDKSLLNI